MKIQDVLNDKDRIGIPAVHALVTSTDTNHDKLPIIAGVSMQERTKDW